MPALENQIAEMFRDADPDVRKVVLEVIALEQELINMKTPRGVFDRIDDILDVVAKKSMKTNRRS